MAGDGFWVFVVVDVCFYAVVLVVGVGFDKWSHLVEKLEVFEGSCVWIQSPPIVWEVVIYRCDVPRFYGVLCPGGVFIYRRR